MKENSLEFLLSSLKSLVTAAQTEIPLYIIEYIDYLVIYHVLWVILSLIVILGYVVFIYKTKDKSWIDRYDISCVGFFSVIGMFLALLAFVLLLDSSFTLLKLHKAPKVVAIEHIVDQIRKIK